MEMSLEIWELASALSKAQAAFKTPKRNAENPFFKSQYADLCSVLEAIKDSMATNGLSLAQFPCPGGIMNILMHSSGQWIKEFCPMPSKDNSPQSIGSSISYARRYSIKGILGLGDEDDDAQSCEPVKTDKHLYEKQEVSKPTITKYTISEKQLTRLYAIAHECEADPSMIKEYLSSKFKLESSKELDKYEYDLLIKEIQAGNLTPAKEDSEIPAV